MTGRGGEVSLVLRDNIIVELLYQPSIMKERCDVKVQKNEVEDEGAVFLDESGKTREKIDFKV